MEAWVYDRSVMPFDVLGRTRATLVLTSVIYNKLFGRVNLNRCWDRDLEVVLFNEDCLVRVCHELLRIRLSPLYKPPVAHTNGNNGDILKSLISLC